MEIEKLHISDNGIKMLGQMKITTVEQLLEIDIISLKALLKKHRKCQTYFDEIYEAIKKLDLHFKYEYPTYYPYISNKSDDLEQIKIADLNLTPDLRKYLLKYDNLGLFFREIAYDKNKLKKFLYINIKPNENYNWLLETLHYLGNNGNLLALNIYKYQHFLLQETLNFNSFISAIISDSKVVQALNKHDIYFIGDLVKYNEEDLQNLEGIGPKTMQIVKEALKKYNLFFNMSTITYYEYEFSLKSFDISILKLDNILENRLRNININNLDDLFFSNKVDFFNTEELSQIRKSFKELGFDITKSFLGSTVSPEVLEYNDLIFRKKILEEELNNINQKLSGLFPIMFSDNSKTEELELTKNNL